MLLHADYPGEQRVEAEVRAAIAAGFDVDILTTRRPGEDAESEVEGARVIRLPIEHRRGMGLAAVLREYVGFTLVATYRAARLAWRHRYGVVQVHNPPDFLVVAALVPRLLGAKMVFDVHDLGPDMFMMRFENAPGGVTDRALRVVERWAARLSDAVLTVHEPYRQELENRGVAKHKITVVMNSLDERLLPSDTEPEEQPGAFRIVYHGTVTPHYGVGLLVEAAARVRTSYSGLIVEIYGEGDAVPKITARVRELGLEEVVRIHPVFLAQDEVLRKVQFASVGVVPNLPIALNRFALSTKLLEYVALGIPVVSADLPTIRYHFSEDEILFFRAGDAASLACALEQVAADPEAAARRASAARARYAEYRWERNALEYTTLMWRMAGTRSVATRPEAEPGTGSDHGSAGIS